MTGAARDPSVAAAQDRAHERATRYHQILREVARATGGRLDGDDGTNVAHAVKELESLDRKTQGLRQDGATGSEALLRVSDLNRYTIVYDGERYTPGVEQARDLLAGHGLTPELGKNTWDDPTYKGYHVRFRDQRHPHAALSPDEAGAQVPRHPVEVQFHTPASLAAKSENHDLYDLSRSGALSREEAAAADELQARRNRSVSPPPGYERLPERVQRQEEPGRSSGSKQVPKEALDRVQERAAALRHERETRQSEPSRAPPDREGSGEAVPRQANGAGLHGSGAPKPPGGELSHMTPERSSAGRRRDDPDDGIDRGGRERG